MKTKNYFLLVFILISFYSNGQINPYVYYTFDGGSSVQWNTWHSTGNFCTSFCTPLCPLTPTGTLPTFPPTPNGPVDNYAIFTNSTASMRSDGVNISPNGFSFETLIRFNHGTGLQKKASLLQLTPTFAAGIFLSLIFDFDVSGGTPSIAFTTDFNGSAANGDDIFNIPLNGLNRRSMQYYLDNNWHHIALSYNPTTGEKRIWIDGLCPPEFVSYAQISPAGFSESSARMTFNPGASQDRIYADIDELAYYDNVISNEEIAQHFNDFTSHSHYTYQLTQPASNNIALSSDPDPNEFPVGHVIGGGELSSAQVVNSGLNQLYSYSLPRFKPTNLLHKNMNLVRSKHFGDNSSSDGARKRYLSLYYQIELATNWNYYFNLAENLSREDGDVNDLNTHAGNWMQWILAHQNDSSEHFNFAVFTNRVQVAGGTKIKYQNFGTTTNQEDYYNVRYDALTNLPQNPYQYVDRAGANSLNKFWLPMASISNYTSDGVLSKSYLDKILTKLNSTLFKINFIAENNEAAPVYWFDDNSFNTSVNAPNSFADNYAVKTDCNCTVSIRPTTYHS